MTTYTRYDGAHPGWTRYEFEADGILWQCLQIDEPKKPHTIIAPIRHVQGARIILPLHYARELPGIVSPEAVHEIIVIAHACYDHGKKVGAEDARAAIRKALGI